MNMAQSWDNKVRNGIILDTMMAKVSLGHKILNNDGSFDLFFMPQWTQ